ncbi:MAG: 50S ribosomal protein L10 [Luteibaculaceae bacterium]
MTREEKGKLIDNLAETLSNSNVVYLADTSALSVEVINNLRRNCFKKNISMQVVKNTLLKKAMERVEGKNFESMYPTLVGATSVLTSEAPNAPAKLIKDFRKKGTKPALKAAYIDEAVFIGDDQLQTLVDLKSKEELVGEIIGLLQSPAKNVISALKSSGQKIAGLVKTLEERNN